MKFKKIVAAIGSVMLLGATVAGAFAANYPAPFTASDTVVVYGNNLDLDAATSIANDLGVRLGASGSVSVSGGYKIEGSSDKWNLGEKATQFRGGKVTKNDLPILSDGVFRDADNTERRYIQEIQLNETLQLKHFSDYDYKRDEPTIGFHLKSGSDEILRYELIFSSKPNASKMKDKEIEFMGKTYYILSADATNDKIELLDSTNKVVVVEGESKVVGGKTVEISSVSNPSGGPEARLTVNGQLLPALKKGNTYKLDDGSYLAVVDIVVGTRERDNHKVEVAIGSGKITLKDGEEVLLNDRDRNANLRSIVEDDGNGNIDKFGLKWISYDESFLTESSPLSLPVFRSLTLALEKINFPVKEETRIETNGADKVRLITQVRDGQLNLDLAYAADAQRGVGNLTGLGRDENNKLVVGGNEITINETNKDRLALVSWKSTSEAETYLISARTSQFDGQNVTTIKNELTGTNFCENVLNNTICRIGRSDVRIVDLAYSNTAKYVKLKAENTQETSFNVIYTKEGMMIALPTNPINATVKEFNLTIKEENRDGTIGAGGNFTVTIGLNPINSENRTDVKGYLITGNTTAPHDVNRVSVSGEDKDIDYVPSELATKIEYRRPSSGQKSMIITYHGSEVSADVFVAASSAVSSSESGLPVVTDSETDKMTGKNLVVVGGPCANAVAAELLGGSRCTSDFTAATGVGAGEFLIQSFNRGGKVALLVAGYEKEDTVKAANYLTKIGVDTAVGKKYKGTSETSATLVV